MKVSAPAIRRELLGILQIGEAEVELQSFFYVLMDIYKR